MNTTVSRHTALPESFTGLVAWHAPRPIHDRASYENSVEVVDAMAGFKLNRDQEDYLEVVSQLIEVYEADTLPKTRKVSGVNALRFLLTENGLNGDDLARVIGVDRSIAYRILKGTRNLTVDHVRKLAARFKVSADLFLG
jgi:HTH-type transcriptional regulator / antitoxin HigA